MKLRTRVLMMAGRSWPVLLWLRRRCWKSGVEVRRAKGSVKLRKGNQAILLAAKHAFFAPEVADAFAAYAKMLPPTERGGVSTADFATSPNAFHLCRRTLRSGVTMESKAGGLWLIQGSRAIILPLQHLVYAPDIAEAFDRYFLPLVPEVRDGLEVLDYAQPGRLQTYRGSGLQFEMASFPEEEEELEESFHWYRPKSGDLVFEIGANCGVSTYQLAQLVGPQGKVVAFEPDPLNFALLERNIKRHRLTNVHAENKAIAGAAGKLAFSAEGTVGSMLMSVLHRSPAGSVAMVDAITLKDAFDRWGVPAFCKIDIEGAEIDVIAASGDLLKAHRTNFVLDTCHLKQDGEFTNRDIETLFRSYGYEAESKAKPLMATWARPLASGS